MLTALAALALSLPAADPSPEPPLVLRPPVVRFTGAFTRLGYAWIGVEVSNPNGHPLPFAGSPSDAPGVILPEYRVAMRDKAGWREQKVMFCKFAPGGPAIPARGKAAFQVHVPAGDWDEVKVGLTWFKTPDRKGGSEAAFCPPVSRKDATPAK